MSVPPRNLVLGFKKALAFYGTAPLFDRKIAPTRSGSAKQRSADERRFPLQVQCATCIPGFRLTQF